MSIRQELDLTSETGTARFTATYRVGDTAVGITTDQDRLGIGLDRGEVQELIKFLLDFLEA